MALRAMVANSPLAVAADSIRHTGLEAGTSSVKQNSKSVSEVLKYIETHSDYMFCVQPKAPTVSSTNASTSPSRGHQCRRHTRRHVCEGKLDYPFSDAR